MQRRLKSNAPNVIAVSSLIPACTKFAVSRVRSCDHHIAAGEARFSHFALSGTILMGYFFFDWTFIEAVE